MKKSLSFVLISGILFSGFFTSCQNFLNGSNLRDQLEEEIEYANTPDVTVTITCNNSYGTLGQTGGTYKLGTSNHELSLEINDSYQFVKWQVYDGDGAEAGCTADDAIYIKNPESLSTTYSLLKEVSGYKITAICKARPYITAASPAYQSSGVSRDRSIIVTFNEDIDESNFRFNDSEAAALEAQSYTLLKDSDGKAYGYTKNGVYYFKNIKIRNANDTTQNLLSFFEVPVISGKKITIAPKSGINNQFALDSNGYKDISVTIDHSFEYDGIQMGTSKNDDYSWSYRVSNVTDSQTTVSITFDSDKGSITPTGTAKYNVGDEIELTFTEKEEYKFIDWNLTESGKTSTCMITYQNYEATTGICTTTITVLEGDGTVSVSPVCTQRPAISSVSPSYTASGVNFDSTISIDFSITVEKENFIYSDSELNNYGSSAIAVLSDSSDDTSEIIAIDIGSERYFKNITITDADGNSLAKHYKKAVLSEDRKNLKIYFDGANLFDFGEKETKSIYVTVSSLIYSNYTKTENTFEKIYINDNENDYDFNFNVKNVSDSKANVTFSAFDSDGETRTGTLNYSGTQSFSLGETFTVTFEPTDNYEFVKWSVTGNKEGNLITTENGTKLICTVSGAVEGIKISPVCEKLGTSTILFATTAGTVSPSGYVDYRRKTSIPLVCTIDSDYAFTKWQVKNLITKEVYSDEKAAQYFKFDDLYSATTNVQILQDNVNLSIVAAAVEKPYVIDSIPKGVATAVSRDTNLRIFLSYGIEESTLYYSDAEKEKIINSGNTLLKNNNNEAYGYYYDANDLSSYVFKNLKIEDNSSGVNYLKYYDYPRFADSDGKIILIPVKKTYNLDGKTISSVSGANLPGKREIKVTLGTEYGDIENNVLVGLKNQNLIWMYKTSDEFDTTFPTLKTSSLKAVNYSGSEQSFENYTSSNLKDITAPTTDFTDDEINWYRNNYVKTVDGKAEITVDITASDLKSNLQSVTLVAEKILDDDYAAVSGTIVKKSLTVDLCGTDGTSLDNSIDLRSDPFNFEDGLYRIYFELMDEVGNITSTNINQTNSETGDSSESYYYVLLDEANKTTKDESKLRRFVSKGKVKVNNISEVFTKSKDIVSTTVTFNGSTTANINGTSGASVDTCLTSSVEFTSLTDGEDNTIKFIFTDCVGNEVSYEFIISSGIQAGMYIYDDLRCCTDFCSELTVLGVVINSDYTNIVAVTKPTYLYTRETIANINSLNDSDGTSLNLVTKIGETDLSYSLPSTEQYNQIYSVKDHLDTCNSGGTKFTSGMTGQSTIVDYSFRVSSSKETTSKYGSNSGIFYFTNTTDVKNFNNTEFGYENHTITESYAGRVLYNAQTNSDRYYYSLTSAQSPNIWPQYTDSCNKTAKYNAKLVVSFTAD